MIEQFEIRDDRGGALIFYEPQFGSDGYCDSYRVRLANDVLQADIDVDGRQHRGVVTGEEEFFADLARSWRGWSGCKVFESLERDLQISATADRTGHVDLHVKITKFPETAASLHLILDAGQSLDDFARDARKFFLQRSTSSF